MDQAAYLPAAEKVKISVRGLNFYYGGFHALKNISLDIPERKVTAFIGPSGCGKSTLLRTFNRMYELYPEQRAEGEINLDGQNILNRRDDVTLLRARRAAPAGAGVRTEMFGSFADLRGSLERLLGGRRQVGALHREDPTT